MLHRLGPKVTIHLRADRCHWCLVEPALGGGGVPALAVSGVMDRAVERDQARQQGGNRFRADLLWQGIRLAVLYIVSSL